MSRAIENYVCASEDRSHYNLDTLYPRGFYYGVDAPYIQSIQVSYNIQATDEQIMRLVGNRVHEIAQQVIDEIGTSLPTLSDEEIDQIINERIGL